MIANVMAGGVMGVDAYLVQVEVSVARGGDGRVDVVGLPETAVKESQVRIRAALMALGSSHGGNNVTINLAPAHIRKSGTAYDLPMAIGMLATRGLVPREALANRLALGELSLDGRVRPVRGALPIAMAARAAGLAEILVPSENAAEAAVVEGLCVYGVEHVKQVIALLRGEEHPEPARAPQPVPPEQSSRLDMSEVRGQERAKRALEIAAAGGHGLLMEGSPGAGKSMLARRLTTILPTMRLEEQLETTKILSVAGLLRPGEGLRTSRPFRAPHHTASDVALVGGGSTPRPGEISLAHNGVLFLDELPEFRRSVLEVLRQPLEERCVTVSRAAMSVTFPANFMLVSAMNPCPCGFEGDPRRRCRCTEPERLRYRARLSGPLLDRIDLRVTVPPVPFDQLRDERRGESSAAVRARVERAREHQVARLAGTGLLNNSQLGTREIRGHCRVSEAAEKLLGRALDRFGLSARAHDRVLRVARTIADLEAGQGEPVARLDVEHVVEALELRGTAV